MSKIMIVGAGDYQLPVVEAASAENEVVLVAPKIDERFDRYISSKYLFDVRNKDEILAAAQKEKIQGIVTDQ